MALHIVDAASIPASERFWLVVEWDIDDRSFVKIVTLDTASEAFHCGFKLQFALRAVQPSFAVWWAHTTRVAFTHYTSEVLTDDSYYYPIEEGVWRFSTRTGGWVLFTKPLPYLDPVAIEVPKHV